MPFCKKLLLPIVMLGTLMAVACSSSAPASPATSASPAAPSSPAASSKAASTAPSAKPGASDDWKAEWDKVLAAAKQEGKVTVVGAQGQVFHDATLEFRKAYPDIELELTSVMGRDITAKILAERDAGMYLWDVFYGGSTDVLLTLMPKGATAPLRPNLILPEVLDDSKWFGGFDAGFMDLDGKYNFAFSAYQMNAARVNRDVVPESELKNFSELVDPKWKGKIAWNDPRFPGAGRSAATYIIGEYGEEFYRKLLANDITPFRDTRQMLEQTIRGRYPIVIGPRTEEVNMFRDQGVLGRVEPLAGANYITGGSGHLSAIDKAPHPNAAKVFINWLLSREGQKIFTDYTSTNSRRLDVTGPAEFAPDTTAKYVCQQHMNLIEISDKAMAIAKEVLQ